MKPGLVVALATGYARVFAKVRHSVHER